MGFYGCMTEPMTLSEFYADERRRASREVLLGREWTIDSDPHVTYSLHWVEETEEIYVLRGPQAPAEIFTPFPPNSAASMFVANDAFEVIVLGRAEDEAVLRRALDGWEGQMVRPNSLQWVRERLYDAAGGTAINGP
jgi:hypothetical protein